MRAALPLPPDLTWILCGSAAWQYTTLRNHTLVTAGQLHPDFRPPRPFSKHVATSRCPVAYVAAAAQGQDLKCENLLAPTHPRLRDSSARIGQSPASHFFGWEEEYVLQPVNSYAPLLRQMALASWIGLFFWLHGMHGPLNTTLRVFNASDFADTLHAHWTSCLLYCLFFNTPKNEKHCYIFPTFVAWRRRFVGTSDG